MALLTADPPVIAIDLDAGETTGTTTVTYEKALTDELWQLPPGGGWEQITDPASAPGFDGTYPVYGGKFNVTLRVGDVYLLGIFGEGRGPLQSPLLSSRARLLASLTVIAVGRRMRSNLILGGAGDSGGTWHAHVVRTSVPTRVAVVCASRTEIPVDADDFPMPTMFDGATSVPSALSISHRSVTVDLLAGNRYWYLVLVATPAGEWDYRIFEEQTLRRQLTVQFKTLHIFNDGDENTTGEAEFRFRVENSGGPGQPILIEEFFMPEFTVDDWSETDRTYPLGFAHIGAPLQVTPANRAVWVNSIGTEDDSPWGSDGAWGREEELFFPTGENTEVVTNAFVRVDCPPSTDGSEFHYGVDVFWSVAYVP